MIDLNGGLSRFLIAHWRGDETLGLQVIQGPATRALDLDTAVLTHAGEKSVALATSAISHHLQSLLVSARLARHSRVRGALAGLQVRSAGWRLGLMLAHQL